MRLAPVTGLCAQAYPLRPKRLSNVLVRASSAAVSSLAFATSPEALKPPTQPLRPKHGVVIVGGGPSGLAAALALTRVSGWTGVTVVEKLAEPCWSDLERSYVYGVDGRGLRCAALFGADEDLRSKGIDSPSITFTQVTQDGSVTVRKRPFRDPSKVTYILPRGDFVGVLMEHLKQEIAGGPGKLGEEVGGGTKGGEEGVAGITLLLSSRVERIERVPDWDGAGERVAVLVKSSSGQEEVLYPSLVLGCDGINSRVRQTLQQWAEEKAEPGAPTFKMKLYPTPSAGLRYKLVRLPPNPQLRSGTRIPNMSFGAVLGTYKRRATNLATMAIKDPAAHRFGTIISLPDHPFWAIPVGDTATYRVVLRTALPQIDLDAIVEEQDFERFANSKGGQFPDAQASDGMAYVVGGSSSPPYKGTSAVVLVGDAAHSFPPDLGQGVNSALQDVQALVECLREHSDSVADAARAYASERTPEAHALAQLIRVGNPYQYRQSYWPTFFFPFRFLWRTLLHKHLGYLGFAPHAISMIQDTTLKYTEILRREKQTRRKIDMLLGSILALAVFGIVKLLRRARSVV